MAQRTVNWLQIKVIAGLAGLLAGAILVVGYLGLLTQENHASQELLSRVRQLEVQGQAIQRRGVTYANNAPRDYAPYERDIIIFYPDFMRDLEAFGQQLNVVAVAAQALPSGGLHAPDSTLADSIAKLQSSWQTFRQGFQEKLGDNPDEPRLEWGAEYVQENQALINSLTGVLIGTIDTAVQSRLKANDELTMTAVAGAGGVLLIGVIWFYFSVVRRISLTVRGCQRVAQGDFGYQLLVRGNDELTSLAQAFNSLSARTRFVLTMLSKMHRTGSAESKVASLWQEASGYLPIQWLGLWQVNPADRSLVLMSMRSDRPIRDTVQKALESAAKNDTQLFNMSMAVQPLKVDNLSEYAVNLADARLLRELVKIGMLNSVLMVPLASDDGWKGLLVFVAAARAAYTDEQIELMGNLSPYMANGFAHAEE